MTDAHAPDTSAGETDPQGAILGDLAARARRLLGAHLDAEHERPTRHPPESLSELERRVVSQLGDTPTDPDSTDPDRPGVAYHWGLSALLSTDPDRLALLLWPQGEDRPWRAEAGALDWEALPLTPPCVERLAKALARAGPDDPQAGDVAAMLCRRQPLNAQLGSVLLGAPAPDVRRAALRHHAWAAPIVAERLRVETDPDVVLALLAQAEAPATTVARMLGAHQAALDAPDGPGRTGRVPAPGADILTRPVWLGADPGHGAKGPADDQGLARAGAPTGTQGPAAGVGPVTVEQLGLALAHNPGARAHPALQRVLVALPYLPQLLTEYAPDRVAHLHGGGLVGLPMAPWSSWTSGDLAALASAPGLDPTWARGVARQAVYALRRWTRVMVLLGEEWEPNRIGAHLVRTVLDAAAADGALARTVLAQGGRALRLAMLERLGARGVGPAPVAGPDEGPGHEGPGHEGPGRTGRRR